MLRDRKLHLSLALLLFLLLEFVPTLKAIAELPSARTLAAYNDYTAGVGLRLKQQRRPGGSYLAPPLGRSDAWSRVRDGEIVVERLTPETTPLGPEAALYHWRGTAFAPGATARGMQTLLTRLDAYPSVYRPQVLQARVLSHGGDTGTVSLRVRQQHVLTVTLDMTDAIASGRPDGAHGFCDSRSLHIAEVEAAGTAAERIMQPEESHGFLWRQDTYWSYAERDGGLYLQLESVSLTRAVPAGLGWALRPFLDSVPRDTLRFTLQATVRALTK